MTSIAPEHPRKLVADPLANIVSGRTHFSLGKDVRRRSRGNWFLTCHDPDRRIASERHDWTDPIAHDFAVSGPHRLLAFDHDDPQGPPYAELSYAVVLPEHGSLLQAILDQNSELAVFRVRALIKDLGTIELLQLRLNLEPLLTQPEICPTAMTVLIEICRPQLMSVIKGFPQICGQGRRDDAFSEVYQRLLRSIHLYKLGTRFDAFIVELTRNICIDILRKVGREARRFTSFEPLHEPGWQEDVSDDPRETLVQLANGKLTDQEMMIAFDRWVLDFSHLQIAQKYGFGGDSANARQLRAFKVLKAIKRKLRGNDSQPPPNLYEEG